MELADESVDGSHYSRMHVASICGSPSISGTVTSNNGNPFCLFYSPTLAIRYNNNVIQSSRASNSWIASLRSSKHSSSSRSPIMSGRQHELPERDNGGWINHCGAFDYGRSPSIDGGSSFSSSSAPAPHSLLPSSSSFRQWGSLESIQRNQRLRQLAAQSKTKVRSLSARESTAAAERWRYIQTVLERRRKESLERRERFIRQPLDHILRQKASTKQVGQAPVWESFVAGRSILKRRALNWRAKAGRHVHFDVNQQPNEVDNNCRQEDEEEEMTREKLPQLPIVSIPEETEAPSNESSFANEEDQRLPLLLTTPSPRLEIITDAQHDPGDERVSPSGPSWVERQVAKVRQRKLWAFRQQQHQHQQQQKLNHHPPRTILKRSVSLLVNVPDDEPETDSLNEEEEGEEGDRSDSGQPVDEHDDDNDDGSLRNSNNRQSLAWEVLLDKDEFVEMSSDQIKDAEATAADDPYGGWPHFPVKLAICIQQRQKSLKERSKAGRKGKEASDGKFHPNNSFERRKRFGKRLSIAVVRQRKRRIPKRGPPLSSIHQPRATSRQSGQSRQPAQNADDIKGHDPAVPANPIPYAVLVGQCLTNAIPLQVLDAADLRPSVDADAIPEISCTHKRNEIDSPVASSPSDLISEADVMTPQAALLDDSSASPESEAETIAVDAQSHLDEMIPAADDSMAIKGTDDEDDDHTAGSAFSPPPPTSRAGQLRREEMTDADETISDVTVDDGPYLIDQPAESTSNVTTAIPPQQDVGMASRPDNIPAAAAGIWPVEQTEFRIASPPLRSGSSIPGNNIDNKDGLSPAGRRLAAYCSGWPIAISNQNGDDDAIPYYSPTATASNWNHFEAPTSEETMAGTINRPEVDVSSDATALALRVPAAQKDSNHPPPQADSTSVIIIQTSLDKKTKEARNASRILFPPAVTSTPTQTEPPAGGSKEKDHSRAEGGNKCRSSTWDSMLGDVKESGEETGTECQCLHRAVLTCLLPEAAETLANLELIRRQLKKARIRRQGMNDQPSSRQPFQVRRDIFSTFDPDSSKTN